MTTTKEIRAGRYINLNTYENCGYVKLTKTTKKIEFVFGRRHYSRIAWQAEDGTTWVYLDGEFGELDTWSNPYNYPRLNLRTRFGHEIG